MDETKGMNFFAYIIAFVIIVWVISAMTGGCGLGFGFNRGGCGNYGGDNLFENYKATVDAKISEIIKEQSEMIEKQQALLNDLITKIGGKDGFNTTSLESDTKGKTTTSKGNGNKSDKKNKSATD